TVRASGSGIEIIFYTDDDIGLSELLEKNNIVFEYYDIKNNDWKEVKRYDYRQKRQSFVTDVDKEAWRQVRKNKKVKPGYKKKMKREQEQIKRRLLEQKNRRKRK